MILGYNIGDCTNSTRRRMQTVSHKRHSGLHSRGIIHVVNLSWIHLYSTLTLWTIKKSKQAWNHYCAFFYSSCRGAWKALLVYSKIEKRWFSESLFWWCDEMIFTNLKTSTIKCTISIWRWSTALKQRFPDKKRKWHTIN